MLYPVFPIFLTQTLGASAAIVGLIEGVATATQNIVQGFSGLVADTLKNRKAVALVGYFFAALAKPLMGIGTAWPTVFFGRFLDRFATGTRSAPRDALIAGSVTMENRGKAFGLEGIGDHAGAFIGPLIAITLLFWLHAPIRSVFYFAFFPAILATVLLLFVKEHHTTTVSKVTITVKQFPIAYWKYLAISFLFGLGTISTSFLILQTRQVDMSLLTTIFIYAFFNLTAALLSYPAGFLSDKFGRKTILGIAFILSICVFLGFSMSTNVYVLAIFFIIFGIYQGVFRAVGKAYATDLIPQELRASGIGWYATTIGVASLLASLIGGQLWVLISPRATFLYAAVMTLIGTLSLLFLLQENSKDKKQQHIKLA